MKMIDLAMWISHIGTVHACASGIRRSSETSMHRNIYRRRSIHDIRIASSHRLFRRMELAARGESIAIRLVLTIV